jgi:hypothetical protein
MAFAAGNPRFRRIGPAGVTASHIPESFERYPEALPRPYPGEPARFAEYAAGRTPRDIAHDLNNESMSPPRGTSMERLDN